MTANLTGATLNLTGARVARQLMSAEDALDTTLGETGKLLASMCEARVSQKLPAVAGRKAIAGLADAVSALEAARRGMLDVHEGLAEVRDAYGLEVSAAGVLPKPGEDTAIRGALIQVA
jgi:hypothetical protein